VIGFIMLVLIACALCLLVRHLSGSVVCAVIASAILAPVVWHFVGYLIEGGEVLSFLPISIIMSAIWSAVCAAAVCWIAEKFRGR